MSLDLRVTLAPASELTTHAELHQLRRRVAELEDQLRAGKDGLESQRDGESSEVKDGDAGTDKLSALVESADDAIVSKDLDGIIRSWNRAAERIFGYKAEEIIGKPITTLAVPGREDEFPTILERLKRGERIDHYQTKRRRKDGRIISVSLTVSPIKNASGEVIGASKVARDITQQKLAEELQLRLAAIIESSDDAIISKDLNGIIQSWNAGAERIFGYTADEIIGKPITMLAVPERLDEIPNIIERLKRGERIDHYQTKRRTKDGRVITVSLTVSPIKDSSGQVIGASKVARDITEHERNQRALQAANEALHRANADLEQFSYAAAHDLQEPLRMVVIYSQMLKKKYAGRLDQQADEFIEYCVEGARRMETLVRDLLAYGRATSLHDEHQPLIDLTSVVGQAVGNLQVAIAESGASVFFDGLPEVHAHGTLIQQLFQNLISNAIKYRSKHAPVITVAAERRQSEWLISVRDNGIGIAPEYKEHVFGLFKRLHGAKEYPGTGLGLAICRRIVERYGGKIWVESTGSGGSTFFFTLPE